MLWDGARVLIVSWKGGTGKTTIATALALAAARNGRSVLLAELEGRPGAAPLMGLPAATFQERATPFGFSLISVRPREALLEYLELFFGMRRVAGPLLRARAVETVTEAAPGFRDMMMTGKLYEVGEWRRTSRKVADRPQYDLIVADAPPTGQIAQFLSAPRAFGELLKRGRPGDHARKIDRFLRDHGRLVFVATAEELAVTETLEAHAAVTEIDFPLGPVVLNRVLPQALPRGTVSAFERLDAGTARRLANDAGLPIDAGQVRAVLEVAGLHRQTEAEQHAQVRRLGDIPAVRVPFVFTEGFGAAEVETVADALEAA